MDLKAGDMVYTYQFILDDGLLFENLAKVIQIDMDKDGVTDIWTLFDEGKEGPVYTKVRRSSIDTCGFRREFVQPAIYCAVLTESDIRLAKELILKAMTADFNKARAALHIELEPPKKA